MFSWFRSSYPVDFKHKVWIEHRLRFLSERLGLDRIPISDVVIPTAEAIPELAPGRLPDIESLTQRLCDRLQIPREGLTVRVVKELPVGEAVGVYRHVDREIQLLSSLLGDPARLLSTLIHELLHDLLLCRGILTGNEPDHEPLTDLSACLLGCGIPLANATFRSASWSDGTFSWSESSRVGYLSSPEFGYALALCCWVEEFETPPSWSCYLRLDAREPLKKGLRFLNQTRDSVFRRESTGAIHRPSPEFLTNSLTHGTDTEILSALWDFGNAEQSFDPSRVNDLLGHKEAEIRRAACELFAKRPAGEITHDPLWSATTDRDPLTRATAVQAFARSHPKYGVLERVLQRAMQESDGHVVSAALAVLLDSTVWNLEIENLALDACVNASRHLLNVNLGFLMQVLVEKTDNLEQKIRNRLSDPTSMYELSEALKELRTALKNVPAVPK